MLQKLTDTVKNKSILLIAPLYFGYEQSMISALEEAGAEVTFMVENVDFTDFRFLLSNRLPEKLRLKFVEKYFIKQIKKLKKTHYDYVFGVRMDFFTDGAIDFLKQKYPDAKYILHYWDSCIRMHNVDEIARKRPKNFDSMSTFDTEEYEKYKDEGWKFRPLFYLPEFERINETKDKDYDIIYIATLSKDRARYYTALSQYCAEHNLKLYTKLYVKKFVYNMQKKWPMYSTLPIDAFSFKSIPLEEIRHYMAHSRVMFDCSHFRQTGLTMRTIECLGARERLITTNHEIKKYDFYDKDNFFILDKPEDLTDIDSIRKTFEGLDEFIRGGTYHELPDDIYERYTLEYWLWDILKED